MTTNGTSMARTARLKQLSATLHGFGGSPVWVFECRARRSGAGVRGRPVEARTDDRDAGEDRRVLGLDQVDVSESSPPCWRPSIGIGVRGVVQPYLGARAAADADGARRRDGGWGEPGVVARLLVLSGTTAASGDDRTMEGASRCSGSTIQGPFTKR